MDFSFPHYSSEKQTTYYYFFLKTITHEPTVMKITLKKSLLFLFGNISNCISWLIYQKRKSQHISTEIKSITVLDWSHHILQKVPLKRQSWKTGWHPYSVSEMVRGELILTMHKVGRKEYNLFFLSPSNPSTPPLHNMPTLEWIQ